MMNEDISAFSQEGYVVVRNVLSGDEIERAKMALKAHFSRQRIIYRYGETQPNAAMEVNDLEWLIAHPSIVALFKKVIGSNDILFTGHCDVHRDMGFGWHKDDGQGRYMLGDYFNEPRHVVKLGIYLDDASDGSGMTLRPGSHTIADPFEGEELTIRSRPGDLLFFDIRISHRGKLYDPVERAMLRLGSIAGDSTGRSKMGMRLRKSYRAARGGKPKRSIFFTYGANDEHTRKFGEANMTRQLDQTGNTGLQIPLSLVSSLTSLGVGSCALNSNG